LDADDLSEPDRLEKQFSFLLNHPEIGLLGTAWNILDEKTKHIYVKHPLINDKDIRKALVRRMPFYHSSMMMPRCALEEVGGYNEQLRVAIDYDLCVRIASHFQIANLPQILVTQRIHPSAFFQQISGWLRYRTGVRISWQAWKEFSGSWIDLIYVISPINIFKQFAMKVFKVFYNFFSSYRTILTKESKKAR
jgi:hypothetical protein